MNLSVIIPAYNEAKQIAGSVAAARAAIAALGPTVACRLIVVDNNSADATAQLARDAGADEVVFEPVNQISRARNAGAAAAIARSGAGPDHWLVFVDADSRVAPGLLADVVDAAAGGTCVGGGAVIRFDPPDTFLRYAQTGMNIVLRVMRMTAGAFMFCRADAFRGVGGFDRTMFAAEDAKFGADLKRWGRSRGLQLRILHAHPLITSARKVALYRPREWIALILRSCFRRGTLRDRRHLGFFYDGKR